MSNSLRSTTKGNNTRIGYRSKREHTIVAIKYHEINFVWENRSVKPHYFGTVGYAVDWKSLIAKRNPDTLNILHNLSRTTVQVKDGKKLTATSQLEWIERISRLTCAPRSERLFHLSLHYCKPPPPPSSEIQDTPNTQGSSLCKLWQDREWYPCRRNLSRGVD